MMLKQIIEWYKVRKDPNFAGYFAGNIGPVFNCNCDAPDKNLKYHRPKCASSKNRTRTDKTTRTRTLRKKK